MGYGSVFLHPRPGLMIVYLSVRWFELVRHAVSECGRLGLVPYLYDENSYPSGFVGGQVPARVPEAMSRYASAVFGYGPYGLPEDRLALYSGWTDNLLVPHLSFTTIRGTRKSDHPQTFSDHSPWYEYLRPLNEELGRLCRVANRGRVEQRTPPHHRRSPHDKAKHAWANGWPGKMQTPADRPPGARVRPRVPILAFPCRATDGAWVAT